VYESQEPGSAFKLMAMVAALDTKAIDTSTLVDTGNGRYKMHGRFINDSKTGGYGEISAARALEVSSNIAFARLIDESFIERPEVFINKLRAMHLDQKIGLPIKGEGNPVIPGPGHEIWSKNAMPSIAYGYNLMLTPLQTLTFYNAIANDGEMVKPRFIKEIRANNKTIETFSKEIIDASICSKETIKKVQQILKDVVVRGTGQKLYSENFSMAGKTGTARLEYGNHEEWVKEKKYSSSFTGYFPAENPKYSCIVVIHKPDKKVGYYGADVSGPVFKDIAQKIYTSNHIVNEIDKSIPVLTSTKNNYQSYYSKLNKEFSSIPNVEGMALMDAIPFLENLGLKVSYSGLGKVKKQSILVGSKIEKGMLIKLTLG